jgi:hypothetical protein
MKPSGFAITLVLLAVAVTPSAAADTPPRVVEVGLFLIDIANLDEHGETYTAEFDVIARWQNSALVFEPAPDEEIPRLLTGDEAVAFLAANWSPQLFAVNVVDAPADRLARALLYPDGTVTVRERVRRVLRAQMDFHWFPFDSQILPVHVESMLYDSDEVRLETEVEFTGFDPTFEIAEWTVTDLTTVNEVRTRLQENQTYDRLSFLVQIDRQRGYYLWKIILPIVVIVILSWIVFWMSTEPLGRRAGVSSTGMLTVIAYQFVVADSLPRFSYQTVLDHFMLASLLTIAATMVVNLVNSRLEPVSRQRLDRSSRVVFPVVYFAAVAVVLYRGLNGG